MSLEISRRMFLLLCGGSVSGVWLPTTGLVQLPADVVLALSGCCSFCGKSDSEVLGLAVVAERKPRICNECIELCVELLLPPTVALQQSGLKEGESDGLPVCVYDPCSTDPTDRLAGELSDPYAEILALLASKLEPGEFQEVRRLMDRLAPPPWPQMSCCSFCEKSVEQVAKTIAGPDSLICNECVACAAALFARAKVT
jgi:hypothetical protein